MTSQIDTMIAAQDPTLFRGVDSSGDNAYRGMEPGNTFTDPGYMSTTTDLATAEKFATKGDESGTVLQILAPAGTQGLHMPSLVPAQFEREVVLPRGGELEVVKGVSNISNVMQVRIVQNPPS
jgi:hypothetical protein